MKIKCASWKFLLCICLIGIVLFPMIYTIFYTIFSADDFSMVLSCNKTRIFRDSIRIANEHYKNWGGIWLYMLIEVLLNPLMHFSLESYGIGMEMVILFLLFIGSLLALINVASRRLLGVSSKENIAVFSLIFLFVFLNTNIYREIFYWFVGSSYMIAITSGMITIILTIEFFFNSKMNGRVEILLSLSGILACNFFQAAVLPGMIFIVIWCWFSRKEHKLHWKKAIPFAFMFMSGLSAVVAPGNYVRHAYFSSSLNIIKGFIDACKMSVAILGHLFCQPFVILLIIYCFYIGIRFKTKSVKGKELLLVISISLLTLILNSFPIALGYATMGLGNRIYFLLDFTAMVGIVVTSVLAGMYVDSLICWDTFFNNCQIKALMVAFVFCFLYSTLIYNQDINELPWFQTVILTRDVKELHDVWQNCLIEIRDSKEDKIEIEIEEKYFDSSILKLPELTDDEEWWVNSDIADYYDKEAITVRKK